MLSVCIMLLQGEITLALMHPPEIIIGENGTIDDVAFHKDDHESVSGFLRYIDWNQVTAILQYPADEKTDRKETAHGKKTG